jgi:ABC-type antimicrobial peptide transport system permease subunit
MASQGGVLVAVGLLVGMPAALAASRLISSLLYGVSSTDTQTYVMVAAALTIVSFIAIVLPAGRAGRVDPMVALREG